MDILKVLRATLLPDTREEAENQLRKIYKIDWFAPSLLKVISEESIELPVRQAAVIYLKNLCAQCWETGQLGDAQSEFTIQETDKAEVRDHIVETLIHAPEPIRVQLAVCVRLLVKFDFPDRWPEIAEKATCYLKSDQQQAWIGAVMCIYQVTKNFVPRKSDDLRTLLQAMRGVLPLCYRRLTEIMTDQSEYSLLLQKQIFKVFRALVQRFFLMSLISWETLKEWMEVFLLVISRPISPGTDQVQDRPQLACWKTKKWALHNIVALHTAIAYLATTHDGYLEFFNRFVHTFSGSIICVLLHVLDDYRQQQYVSPAMLLNTLRYLTICVDNEVIWNTTKPHMTIILKEVIFPMMCHNEDDEELWQSDPVEYATVRFEWIDENYYSLYAPVDIAQRLLHSVVSKSDECLNLSLEIIMQVLGDADIPPQKKAGALYMISVVADMLIEKSGMGLTQNMIINCVLNQFHSEHGYLRAAACWLIAVVQKVGFNCENILPQMCQSLFVSMCGDKEVAVRVEAAYAIEKLLTESDEAVTILKPHIREMMLQLMNIIQQTDQFSIVNVMEAVVHMYADDIASAVVDTCVQFANGFAKLMESDRVNDKKLQTAKIILNTLDTLVSVIEKNKQGLFAIEGIILGIVGFIYENRVMDLYDYMLALLLTLTAFHTSPSTWKALPMLHDLVKEDTSLVYIADVVQILHQCVTGDMHAFTSDSQHLETIYSICQMVLSREPHEEVERVVVKLLESVLLQFEGQVDSAVPSFCHIALVKLTSHLESPTLRVSYLQVLIAAMYYDTPLLLGILNQKQSADSSQTYADIFISCWFKNINYFKKIHSRKLCVLGLCSLLEVPPELRSPCLLEHADKVIPSIIKLLKDLQVLYTRQTGTNAAVTYESSMWNDDDDEKNNNDSDHKTNLLTESVYESFKTAIDGVQSTEVEFQMVKDVLLGAQQTDPQWFSILTSALTYRQREDITSLLIWADGRKTEMMFQSEDEL